MSCSFLSLSTLLVLTGRNSYRDLGLLHQAIYCFTQAVKANKGDVNSMWDRAYLLKMSGATKMVRRIRSQFLPRRATHSLHLTHRLSKLFKHYSNYSLTIPEFYENSPRSSPLTDFTPKQSNSSSPLSPTTVKPSPKSLPPLPTS